MFECVTRLFLCQLFVTDLGPALVVELVVVAYGCFDLVERFALCDHFFYLSAAGFCVGDSLLDVGFGLDVAVAGDEGVGVEGDDSFGCGDPAFGGSVLLVVDARVGVVGGDDVAGGDDLLGGQVDDEVAAGVRGGPVVELELLAFDGEGFFVFVMTCVG